MSGTAMISYTTLWSHCFLSVFPQNICNVDLNKCSPHKSPESIPLPKSHNLCLCLKKEGDRYDFFVRARAKYYDRYKDVFAQYNCDASFKNNCFIMYKTDLGHLPTVRSKWERECLCLWYNTVKPRYNLIR